MCVGFPISFFFVGFPVSYIFLLSSLFFIDALWCHRSSGVSFFLFSIFSCFSLLFVIFRDTFLDAFFVACGQNPRNVDPWKSLFDGMKTAIFIKSVFFGQSSKTCRVGNHKWHKRAKKNHTEN